MFKENGGKKNKVIKFKDKEYKALLNKAKKKGIPTTKNINIPVIKNCAILPNGKKVKVG